MGLILEDAAINIRLGTDWDGTATTYTGVAPGASFMARARRINPTEEVEMTNVKGAGDRNKKNRYHNFSGKVTLSGVVLAAGYFFRTMPNGNAVGKHIEITTVPLSSMEDPDVFEGVITKWDGEGSMGEASIETIEIDLNPDIV